MAYDRPANASEGGAKRRYDGPRYQRLAETFWTVVKSRGWADDEIILFLYILSSKHRTLEGFFVLPVPYIVADLVWKQRRVHKSMNILIKNGVIAYDSSAEVLLIKNSLKYQTPDSSNVVSAVIARVKRLPKTILLNEFIALAKVHCTIDGTSRSAAYLPQALEQLLQQVSVQVLEHVSQLLNLNPKSDITNPKSQTLHTEGSRSSDKDFRRVGMESSRERFMQKAQESR